MPVGGGTEEVVEGLELEVVLGLLDVVDGLLEVEPPAGVLEDEGGGGLEPPPGRLGGGA